MFTSLLHSKQSAPNELSSAPQRSQNRVIGVIGAKGGVGATTLSINLAAHLRQCFMVDANLQQPAAAIMLGRGPKYGLVELLERADPGEIDVAVACSVPISLNQPNAHLISGPLDGSAALTLNLTQLATCLEQYRDTSASWLIDLPKHLDHHLVTLMDQCDKLLLVFEPTLAATTMATSWMRVFSDLGYSGEKIIPVLNRSGSKPKSVQSEIENAELFQRLVRIPNAFELAEDSWRQGEPAALVNPKSAFSAAVRQLAAAL